MEGGPRPAAAAAAEVGLAVHGGVSGGGPHGRLQAEQGLWAAFQDLSMVLTMTMIIIIIAYMIVIMIFVYTYDFEYDFVASRKLVVPSTKVT